MRRVFFNILICFTILASTSVVSAQMHNPVKWSFSASAVNEHEAILTFTAMLEEGWHIYSQHMDDGGPLPTSFTFTPTKDYSLVGKVKEEVTPVKSYDETFMMDILWFENKAVFTQKIKLKTPATAISGNVEYMVCTNEMCLPPDRVKFNVQVAGSDAVLKK